jgi:two-component system, NarL family, invasion response regulator UvrY
MKAAKNKILIADDHRLFRSGLREILSGCAEAPLIDEASTGPETIKKFSEEHYDCVLLDIFMPGQHGLEIIKQLKSINPAAHILVLSMYPEEQYGIRALKAGASGYLTKDAAPEVLKEAIRKVCSGQKYIVPSLAEKLSEEIQTGGRRTPHGRLTDRELQIVTMIASGKTLSQVAAELYLSIKTVSTHRAHILQKMGLKNTAEIIRYAIRNFLVF